MIFTLTLYLTALILTRYVWREKWGISALIALGGAFTITGILITLISKQHEPKN